MVLSNPSVESIGESFCHFSLQKCYSEVADTQKPRPWPPTVGSPAQEEEDVVPQIPGAVHLRRRYRLRRRLLASAKATRTAKRMNGQRASHRKEQAARRWLDLDRYLLKRTSPRWNKVPWGLSGALLVVASRAWGHPTSYEGPVVGWPSIATNDPVIVCRSSFFGRVHNPKQRSGAASPLHRSVLPQEGFSPPEHIPSSTAPWSPSSASKQVIRNTFRVLEQRELVRSPPQNFHVQDHFICLRAIVRQGHLTPILTSLFNIDYDDDNFPVQNCDKRWKKHT